MIVYDEDALLCDFAEYYNIMDIYSLPVETAATLAAGLRINSRIRSEMMGLKEGFDTFLQAEMVDILRLLLWTKTKDATKGHNKPGQLTDMLWGKAEKKEEMSSYDTVAELKAARRRLLQSESLVEEKR